MAYNLTRKAADDLIHIYGKGFDLLGQRQAELYHAGLEKMFQLLSEKPEIARERKEINPPVRIHPYKSHIIIYIMDDDGDILIIRVRHGHEDWKHRSVNA